jgi:AraC-like DNA-binding protein
MAPHVAATHWIDRRASAHLAGVTPPDVYVVRVFLSAAVIRIDANDRTIVDGAMGPGTVHVSLPGDVLSMTMDGTCDSLQWYLPGPFVRDAAGHMGCTALLDNGVLGGIYRDTVIEQLALALLAVSSGPCLLDTAGHFAIPVLSRLFQLAGAPTVTTLDPVKLAMPRWRMRCVDTYIHQHLGDPISLAAVASAAGLSPMHFASRFRLATGQRPHHYILRARIEHAKVLLTSSGRSVVEVAGDAGFRTQAHFSTIFKQFTGATPCAWRRERAGE